MAKERHEDRRISRSSPSFFLSTMTFSGSTKDERSLKLTVCSTGRTGSGVDMLSTEYSHSLASFRYSDGARPKYEGLVQYGYYSIHD